MNRFKIPFIAMTTVLAAFVWAQNPGFEELDRDGDGYVSAREAMVLPCLAENFDRVDAESADGLNKSEYARALQQYCQPDEQDWPEP